MKKICRNLLFGRNLFVYLHRIVCLSCAIGEKDGTKLYFCSIPVRTATSKQKKDEQGNIPYWSGRIMRKLQHNGIWVVADLDRIWRGLRYFYVHKLVPILQLRRSKNGILTESKTAKV